MKGHGEIGAMKNQVTLTSGGEEMRKIYETFNKGMLTNQL